MSYSFVPTRALLISLAMVIMTMLYVVSLALQPPWLGLQLGADEKAGLLVISVDESGPAAGQLRAGERLLALQGGSDSAIELNANTLIEEPDFLNDYDSYNAFFIRQTELYKALSQSTVTLYREQGAPVTLTPLSRTLIALPFVFWFQIICGLVAVVTGISVWCFRPADRPSRYYALTGVGLAITIWTAAVYSSRELAIDGELFYLLSLFDHLGALFFSSAYCALLLNYPTQLWQRDWSWVGFSIYFLFGLVDAMQWVSNMDLSFRYPIYAGFVASVWLSLNQWRNSRGSPVDRAALKWFLFSLYVGCTLFIVLVFLPVSLGMEPLVSQAYSFGLIIAMYLGFLLGITRYRLFNLERWWLTAWVWLLGGVLLIAVDTFLVVMLNMTQTLALGLSLALAGWGYIPLRNLLWQYFQPQEKGVEHYFGEVIHAIFQMRQADEAGQVWLTLLKRIYSPLAIKVESGSMREPEVLDNGLNLRLPALEPDKIITMAYAQRGQRLFCPDDLSLINSLHFLIEQAMAQQTAIATGAIQERKRIRRDLHDDLGAKLLTLLYKLKQPEDQSYVREALQDLREVVASLEQKPRLLADALADWHDESQDRCDAAGVALEWRQPEIDDDQVLASRTQTNLRRVIREAVTNALRHARPEYLQIVFTFQAEQLSCVIINDGVIEAGMGVEGRGCHNLRERIEELGGHIDWSIFDSNQYQVHWNVPLPATSSVVH